MLRRSIFLEFNNSLRRYSTAAQPGGEANSIAAWIQSITAQAPKIAHDLVDVERAGHLHRTLPTRTRTPVPVEGDVLRKGHHLVYMQPRGELVDLGEDGSSTDYNAPAPYLRRMWAGGHFEWPHSHPEGIRIGSSITEHTRVAKAEHKAGMIFIDTERIITDQDSNDVLLKETRTHVYRPSLDAVVAQTPEVAQQPKKTKTSWTPPSQPDDSFTIMPTSPLLFRFSALTFNGHRIHYDKPWAQEREGHPDIVFHGPLSSLLLVELASRSERDGRMLRHFSYRATHPMYVDKEITFACKWRDGKKMDLWAVQEGKVGMKADAIFE